MKEGEWVAKSGVSLANTENTNRHISVLLWRLTCCLPLFLYAGKLDRSEQLSMMVQAPISLKVVSPVLYPHVLAVSALPVCLPLPCIALSSMYPSHDAPALFAVLLRQEPPGRRSRKKTLVVGSVEHASPATATGGAKVSA